MSLCRSTVFTDDEAYSMTFEFDSHGVYPLRREHLGLYVREVPEDVERELVASAYAQRREKRDGE